jgi:hypothetical protein
MSQAIPTHFVQQYTTNVQLLLQQRGSKLRQAVMEQRHVGKQAVAVDQWGAVNAAKRVGRYQPLVPQDTPSDRRWVFPNDYDWNDLIDNFDKLRMITDPQSSYVLNGTYAMGRSIDDEIIASMFGDNKTGENGATSTGTLSAFNSGAQLVGTNIGGANSNLNLDKLRNAKKILMQNEVDVDTDPLFVAMTASQHDALLAETQVVSLDYNTRPVLVDGKITSFMGFNFIVLERLPKAGAVRSVAAWAKSGMHLGLWEDIKTDVRQRADLSSLPWQVYVQGTFGATRTEEKKVVQINCTEA